MERFYMRLADKTFAVSANYVETKGFCRNFLIEEPEQADFEVIVTKEEIEKFRSVLEKNGIPTFSEKYGEIITLQQLVNEKLSFYHTVTFHCSAIAVDGEVYIFTAPSGTGKSTHARLWRELLGERAFMVNDDKPMMHLNEDGSVTVYGTPWQGKHSLGANIALPLKAVCIISQAEENKISKVSTKDSFQTIFLQTFLKTNLREMEAEAMKQILEVMEGIANCPIWHLECNISREAAKLSYETMSGEKLED